MGKIFGILISFLGVGMVAIPTGIISAGFVDQYSTIKKKAEYERWYDIHAPYFDQPEALPKGKVVYSVYAPNDVAINMSTYGWKQQKALTSSVEYLVVDTTVIPNFDRFLYKIDAVDRGDLQKAKNFVDELRERNGNLEIAIERTDFERVTL